MTQATPDRPYRDSTYSIVMLPLRSDPPWLRLGLVAVTAACVAAGVIYFAALRLPSIALGILPGLALATFAGSALAWWGRRRGATMQLEASDQRLVLREPRSHSEVIDRSRPFGALVVYDPATGYRALVLSQGDEPAVVYDPRRGERPGGAWAAQTVEVDLSGVAMSPASSHVLTVAVSGTLDPLLAKLETDVNENTPLLMLPLPSGETLLVGRDDVRAGSRVITRAARARRLVVQTPTGEATALSVVDGESSMLLACQDPAESLEATGGEGAPDVYLPAILFAALAARFALDTSSPDGAPQPYKP